MSLARQLTDRVAGRVANAAADPFRHVDYPLRNTFDYVGDPGLFGPGSATWPIMGDVATFIGGIRALLIQAAHPEVAAGVFDHSDYRADPLGRLSRTSAYVTVTAFGAMPEVEAAVAVVRNAHRPVRGSSHRGRPYSAGHPALAAWVHNALTESFLTAHRVFGGSPLDERDADRFVEEQTKVGTLLDADPLPTTAVELGRWVAGHRALGTSPGQAAAVEFLASPPLPATLKAGYALLFQAAVATLPARVRDVLGVRPRPGAIAVGRRMIATLRWAMGFSPSWNVALLRVGADVPPGLFKQPLPIGEAGRWG